MKFRVVKAQGVRGDGSIWTRYRAQYKGLLFWRTVTEEKYDGCGEWHVYPLMWTDQESAEKWIADECARLRKVRDAWAQTKSREVVAEMECDK